MGETNQTYARLGIPEPSPCPSWCAGNHAGSYAGTGYAALFHGGSGIGGGVRADGAAVTISLTWMERFERGAWQPFRGDDVTVHFQVGMDHISITGDDRNLAGLAATADLISPDVHAQVQHVQRLLTQTADARRTPEAQ